MNEKICKTIVEHKIRFVPHLFTERQVELVGKWLNQQPLSASEKTYVYGTIAKKINALCSFSEEFYITGKNMIPERVEEAKKILSTFAGKRAFISGSFLFSPEYNDIDVFVIDKRCGVYTNGTQRIMHLAEKDLKNPIYLSSFRYSVANFYLPAPAPLIKRPDQGDLIFEYEHAINEILDNDDQKSTRTILFDYYLLVKKKLLDSYSLYKKCSVIKKRSQCERIGFLNKMVKQLLLHLYSKKYLYKELTSFINKLKQMTKTYKTHDNLLIYIKLFNEVKNECRRTQAGA